ncbi:MAG: NAD(P)H-hydrate epimerase, partial [Pseudomonadota bacterium]
MSDATPDTRSTRFTPAPAEVLTSAEMAAADAHAIANGVPSLTLMENAGHAVAVEAADLVATAAAPRARIAVLCGPGNNGGDGFAAARHLKEMGADVALFALRPPAQLKGDAAAMAQRWDGPVQGFDAIDPAAPFDLLIDAAFGTGLRAD